MSRSNNHIISTSAKANLQNHREVWFCLVQWNNFDLTKAVICKERKQLFPIQYKSPVKYNAVLLAVN